MSDEQLPHEILAVERPPGNSFVPGRLPPLKLDFQRHVSEIDLSQYSKRSRLQGIETEPTTGAAPRGSSAGSSSGGGLVVPRTRIGRPQRWLTVSAPADMASPPDSPAALFRLGSQEVRGGAAARRVLAAAWMRASMAEGSEELAAANGLMVANQRRLRALSLKKPDLDYSVELAPVRMALSRAKPALARGATLASLLLHGPAGPRPPSPSRRTAAAAADAACSPRVRKLAFPRTDAGATLRPAAGGGGGGGKSDAAAAAAAAEAERRRQRQKDPRAEAGQRRWLGAAIALRFARRAAHAAQVEAMRRRVSARRIQRIARQQPLDVTRRAMARAKIKLFLRRLVRARQRRAEQRRAADTVALFLRDMNLQFRFVLAVRRFRARILVLQRAIRSFIHENRETIRKHTSLLDAAERRILRQLARQASAAASIAAPAPQARGRSPSGRREYAGGGGGGGGGGGAVTRGTSPNRLNAGPGLRSTSPNPAGLRREHSGVPSGTGFGNGLDKALKRSLIEQRLRNLRIKFAVRLDEYREKMQIYQEKLIQVDIFADAVRSWSDSWCEEYDEGRVRELMPKETTSLFVVDQADLPAVAIPEAAAADANTASAVAAEKGGDVEYDGDTFVAVTRRSDPARRRSKAAAAQANVVALILRPTRPQWTGDRISEEELQEMVYSAITKSRNLAIRRLLNPTARESDLDLEPCEDPKPHVPSEIGHVPRHGSWHDPTPPAPAPSGRYIRRRG